MQTHLVYRWRWPACGCYASGRHSVRAVPHHLIGCVDGRAVAASPPRLQVGTHLASWGLLGLAMFVYVPSALVRGGVWMHVAVCRCGRRCGAVRGGVWWCVVVWCGVMWCVAVCGGARWCVVVCGGVRRCAVV